MTSPLAGRQRPSPRRPLTGFSLLETLLVLGVAAVAIVAIFVIYPQIQSARRAHTETTNLSSVVASMRSLYEGSANYASVSNTMLLNAKAFPAEMVAPDGVTVTNVWGGQVLVLPSTVVPNGFEITEKNVPPSECARLVAAADSNFSYIAVQHSVLKGAGKDLTVAETAQACAGGVNGNQILFDDR